MLNVRCFALTCGCLLIASTVFAQGRPTRNPGAAPAQPVPAGGNGSFALLPRIRIQTQTRRGHARMSKGKLYLNQEKNAAQVVLTAPAPPEYDLTFKGVRSLGEGTLIAGFVMDGQRLHFVVNEHRDDKIVTGLRTIVDKKVKYPNGVYGSQFKTGRPFELIVHVRRGEVAATLDGRKLFYWQGKGTDPYPDGSNFYKIKEDPSFSVGSWNAKFDFDEINLTPLRNAGQLAWNLNKAAPAVPVKPAMPVTPTKPMPADTASNTTPGSTPGRAEPEPALPKQDAGLKADRSFPYVTKNRAVFAISPSARYVAANIQDDKVTIFDTATGKEAKSLETGGNIAALSFAKSSRGLPDLYVGQGSNVQQWNTAKGERTVNERMAIPISIMEYVPRYDILFASSATFHAMYMLKVESPLRVLGNAVVYGAYTVSPDGDVMAAAGYSRELFIHDVWNKRDNVANGHMRYKLTDLPSLVTAVDFSRDSKRLAVGFKDGLVRIYDVASQKIVSSLKTGAPVGSLIFSSDGKQLAVSYKGINIYDIAKGEVIKEIVPATWHVRRMTASGNRSTAAAIIESQNKEKLLQVWSMSKLFSGEPAAPAIASNGGSTAAGPAESLSYRTWRTADGKYEIIAAFVRASGSVVYLKRKNDGAVIPVKKELLSRPDLSWVRLKSK